MYKIKHFVEQSWLLIVSAFLFGLLIAVTNAAWSPRIEENERNKLYYLMGGLIGDANSFEVALEEVEVPGRKGKVLKTNIYKAVDDDGKGIGFAYVAIGAGFADKIKLVIAVDGKCEKFYGYKVLASNETPGFGSKIITDADFFKQFKDAPVASLKLIKAGKTTETEIVAISGATVSSESVVEIINNFLIQIKEQMPKKD